MKKIIIFILCLAITINSFSQQSIPPTASNIDYMKRGKHLQTAATITLIACPVLIGLPLLITQVPGGSSTGVIIYGSLYAGFLCLPISIVLFILASHQMKKAKAVSLNFKMEPLPGIPRYSFTQSSYPALSLRLKLK